MRWSNAHIQSIGYELAPVGVTTTELEDRVAETLDRLHVPRGQIAEWTGVDERRWWPEGFRVSDGAILAARDALEREDVDPTTLGAVIYAGVCRDQREPATACRVADAIGAPSECAVFDISNACLGVVTGIIDLANRVQLGQIERGLVCSCETAREIVEIQIDRLQKVRTMEELTFGLATFTGGSGACAVIVERTDAGAPRMLRTGIERSAARHHELCRWGVKRTSGSTHEEYMRTDSVGVLEHGVALGRATWDAFLSESEWSVGDVDRTICHQVGSTHQRTILEKLGVDPAKDFATFPYLGNIGTVSLPITAALAEEQGRVERGQRVAALGIGSGLNTAMLAIDW